MFLKYNIYTFLWALLMLFMVLLPGNFLPKTGVETIFGMDKLGHAFVFCILILLMIVGFSKQYTYRILRDHAISFSLVFSFGYGLIMELGQSLVPGRNVEFFDIVANTVGCVFGIGIFFLIYGNYGQEKQ